MTDAKAIHEWRFRDSNPGEFERLWNQVAQICGVDPARLHEDDELLKLCPPPRWSHINEKMDALVHLALRERPGSPSTMLITVGDLIDWMLEHRKDRA